MDTRLDHQIKVSSIEFFTNLLTFCPIYIQYLYGSYCTMSYTVSSDANVLALYLGSVQDIAPSIASYQIQLSNAITQ